MRALLVGLVFGLAGCAPSREPEPPRAVQGVIDLRSWDFDEDGPVRLDGEWDFVWGRPAVDDRPWPHHIRVPAPWAHPGSPAPAPVGAAGYRVRVELPPDAGPLAVTLRVTGASRVWVDGNPRESVGVVGGTADTTLEDVRTQVFAVGERERLELVVEAANFRHRQSGLRRSVVLGRETDIFAAHRRAAWVDAAAVSPIVLLGVLYGFLYFFRRRETSYLWFGVFAICLGTRHLFAGDGELILEIWPSLPWPLRLRLEYLLFPVSGLPAIAWLRRAAGLERLDLAGQALFGLGLALVVATLVAPMTSLGLILQANLVYGTVGVMYGAIILGRAAFSGRWAAWGPLIGAGVFSVGLAHDAAVAAGLWRSEAEIAPLAFLSTLLLEGAFLAATFVRSFVTVEAMAAELRQLNANLERAHRASLRFVPQAFLSLLGRRALAEVQRGDHTEQTMEVLFCDIRGFTTLIEGLGPERAFPFINRYLTAMEPAITQGGGFISQYIGDCIVALFPGPSGSDAAVASAIEMCERLRAFNLVEPEGPVRIGIGMSSGPLMLGTIGGKERLDGGVIGDPVNQASRIEGLTKAYGVSLLIGEPTRDRLRRPEAVHLREIDRVVTKGKTQAMLIFEVLDALEPVERARRLGSAADWARGREAWERGDFSAARDAFLACLAASPDDEPAARQVRRCEAFLEHPPATWDGVTTWTTK